MPLLAGPSPAGSAKLRQAHPIDLVVVARGLAPERNAGVILTQSFMRSPLTGFRLPSSLAVGIAERGPCFTALMGWVAVQ